MTREEFLALSTEEQFRIVEEATGAKILLNVIIPTDDRAAQSRQQLAEASLRQLTDAAVDAGINGSLYTTSGPLTEDHDFKNGR